MLPLSHFFDVFVVLLIRYTGMASSDDPEIVQRAVKEKEHKEEKETTKRNHKYAVG
jgi:hypothetical protein